MWYLLLAITSMSAIMLTLKVMGRKGVEMRQAIVVNYLLASVAGIVSTGFDYNPVEVIRKDWIWIAALAGSMFLLSMNLLAYSTKRVGVAVTTVSSRTALILPILFSYLFLGEALSARQTVGIALTVTALVLIFSDRRTADRKKGVATLLLPIGVFFMTGTLDIVVKYAQHSVSGRPDYGQFEPSIFLSALILAVIYYSLQGGRTVFRPSLGSIVGGVCLGLFNFLATYGVLHGLKYVATGIFYPTYYIGVVVLTSAVGITVFSEKLGRVKLIGLALAVVAIGVLAG